jgi:rubrerythrin
MMKSKIFIGVLCFAVAVVTVNGCKKQEGTVDNLKKAITGETTASAKYAACAIKAKEEKFDKIARLFEAASKAEAIHAKKHTEVLKAAGVDMDPITPQFSVKSTRENLQDAIAGESYEIATMYPEFIKKASDEKKSDAVASFDAAFKVEKKHKELYTAALAALEKNDLKALPDAYSVCPVCGNTFGKNVPAACDICGAPKKDFIIVK